MTTHPPRCSIQSILIDNNNWERYKLNHPELDPYKASEVDKMLLCCNPKKGYFVVYCEHCSEGTVVHLRCNSKVCTNCGTKYVDQWVKKQKRKLLEETHRLVTLTVPADLRPLLKDRWNLLRILQESANETIVKVASKKLRKQVKIGMLVGLQTYGQDMKFHPHVHCMIVEKVIFNGQLIDFKYVPKQMLRRVWTDTLIKNLCRGDVSHQDKILLHSMEDKYPYGFITDVGKRSMRRVEVIRYLARYMRHPAIANRRILFYGRDKVIIRLVDKQKREYSTWYHVDEFIAKMIQHIQPKQFRVVRWYGLYSRREVRLNRKHNEQRLETISSEIDSRKMVFRCKKCNNPMIYEFIMPNKPPDKRFSREQLDYWIQLAN